MGIGTSPGTRRVIIIDRNGREAELDRLNYLPVLELEHHKVHEGVFYVVSDVDLDVDVAGPKYWHIKTPNSDVRFHVKINIECDTGSLLEFFENPTLTDDGVALVAYNADRNSGNTSTVESFSDPTASADGTRIQVARVGAGREKKLGGTARAQAEWILKKNESYLVKITVDANDAQVTMNLEGYEV